MRQKERFIVAAVLLAVASMVGIDLFNDSQKGVETWHLALEAGLGLASLFGVFYILKGSFELRRQLKKTRIEADAWRAEAKKYVDGLSESIDRQLIKWDLSGAEKEVAFLLLKGLSLKEIAEVRKTSVKTARTQSLAIYAKSGLGGRSELAAFFLEDLFVPSS